VYAALLGIRNILVRIWIRGSEPNPDPTLDPDSVTLMKRKKKFIFFPYNLNKDTFKSAKFNFLLKLCVKILPGILQALFQSAQNLYEKREGSGSGSGSGSVPQSRQSAKLFLQSLELGFPTPLAAGECASPPLGPGGRVHSLAAKGVGEFQFRRGDIYCGALYL
jgi:hypothetical protein